jgi:hypothetical protein
MLFPNKVFTYDESVLSKLSVILKKLKRHPMSVKNLYQQVIKEMDGVNEFIDALDCLYALHKIEYDETEGVIRYVV